MDAVTGQHLRLPVQREMPGEFRDGDMCHQRCRWQSTVDWARRRRGLHHGGLTGAAAVFRPADAFDPDDRRHDVQHLTDVVADPMQSALAARTNVTLRLDDDIFARQMIWRAADITRGLWARGPR